MSPETKAALETFAKEAQWRSAGSEVDQKRLLDFIICAFKNGEFTITQEEFVDVLNSLDSDRANGEIDFSQKRKSISFKLYTYQKYEEGTALLRHYTQIEDSKRHEH